MLRPSLHVRYGSSLRICCHSSSAQPLSLCLFSSDRSSTELATVQLFTSAFRHTLVTCFVNVIYEERLDWNFLKYDRKVYLHPKLNS